MSQLPKAWKNLVHPYYNTDKHFPKIFTSIEEETFYPVKENIFKAFSFFSPSQTKVIILAFDPYPREHAQGLSFSVDKKYPIPGSLKNIFKELHDDLGIPTPNHGCLEKWAKQGVLLLNTCLSVEAGKAHSHANIGWEEFTDKIINVSRYE